VGNEERGGQEDGDTVEEEAKEKGEAVKEEKAKEEEAKATLIRWSTDRPLSGSTDGEGGGGEVVTAVAKDDVVEGEKGKKAASKATD